MTLDVGWSEQAVTALDLAALSASESIMSSSSQDRQGGQSSPFADTVGSSSSASGAVELTNGRVYDSEAMGLQDAATPTDYASGELRPTTATDVGGAQDRLRDITSFTQLDQAYSSSLAASVYTDQQYLGRIVDYTA